MAVKKQGAEKAPFKPSDLTLEQQALVVEEYLGVHPDFFIYKGPFIQVNLGKFRSHHRGTGVTFGKWKPKAR